MRGRTASILVAAILLTAWAAPAAVSAAAAPTAPRPTRAAGPTLTLATFNLLTPARGGPAWKPRRSRALQLIRRTDADVVVLQESGAFEVGGGSATFPAGWLARKAGYALAPFDSSRRADGSVVHHRSRITNLQILCRPGRLTVDTSQEATVGSRNNFSHMIFRDRRTGRAFTVLDAHLFQGLGRSADRARARHIAEQIERMRERERRFGFVFPPIYVVGDLNTDRRTRRSAVTRTLRSYGLLDSVRIAEKRSRTWIDTFNGRRRSVGRHGRRVDQVWVPRGTEVTRWRQVVDIEDGRYRGRLASDHNPVVVTVRPRG